MRYKRKLKKLAREGDKSQKAHSRMEKLYKELYNELEKQLLPALSAADIEINETHLISAHIVRHCKEKGGHLYQICYPGLKEQHTPFLLRFRRYNRQLDSDGLLIGSCYIRRGKYYTDLFVKAGMPGQFIELFYINKRGI